MKKNFNITAIFTVGLMLLNTLLVSSQTIIFQSGFELTDPAFTYATGPVNIPIQATTGGVSGPYCGKFTSNGKYDGAFITGATLNLQAGKYYQLTYSYKVATCGGSLKIYRNTTGASYANISAGTLMNTIVSNQAAYVTNTFVFTVASNVSNFIGFVSTMTANGCNSANFWIDDVTVTEYDYPPCGYYCVTGNASATTSYMSNVTFSGINRSSGWDGSVCTGQAATVRRTQSYNLSLTALNSTASQKVVAAWIDWNMDGVYANPGELVLGPIDITTATPPQSPVNTVSVTVPPGAVLGTTKMRVAMVIGTVAQTVPCNILQLSDYEDYDVNVLPAPVPMVYSSTVVTQMTNNVNAGSTTNEVLSINIKTTGQLTPPSATQLVLTTLGTTNVADITNARIYYTGSSNAFSSATQMGATIGVPPADPTTMSFNFTKVLSEGDNYFWIAYDVIATAPGGDVIDAKLSSTTVGGTNYPLNSTPIGSRPIIASFPMSYVSSTVVQNSNPVPIGSANNDIIQVQVVTTGAITPLSTTALTFRVNGTTNVGDIQNARVYFTGDIPTFSTAVQFGATLAVLPAFNTDFTFNGSATLLQGTNYFWLTYEVKGTAACNPAQIDALCNNVTVAATNYVPTPTAPVGARVINCGTAYYSQCTCDFNNPANWNTLRAGGGAALPNTAAFAIATNSFYVQNGHTMTSSAALTVSDLYLEPGSYVLTNYLLTITKLYIESFATFEQTYAQTNNALGGNYISNFYIKKDGTWKHNNNGFLPGTSGTQYFEPYSIQWFLGVGAGTFPGGTNWGSVILDIPAAPNLIINANSISFVHGDLTIRKWGAPSNYLYINMDNPITVDGDLNITGGFVKGVAGFSCNVLGCTCNAAASGVAVNVAGNFYMSGGIWNDFNCGANSSTGMAMSIGGNVTITGGTINMNNNTGSKLDLLPVTVSTTWSQTGGSVTLGNTNVKAGKTLSLIGNKMGDVAASRPITVETGAKLYCSNYPVTGAGLFTLQTGAWLGIGSAAGITSTGATGNIQSAGIRSYNSGATYEYYEGLTPQATGNFLTTTTSGTYPSQVANLIINKAAPANIVNLTNTTDVTTLLTLTGGVLTTSMVSATAPWVRIPSVATVTPVGGSVNSYVDGYIRRQGATAFTFPTGNAGKWRRIAFTAPSATTEFEARYVSTAYANTTAMALAPLTVLDHISTIEHWYLVKPLGADAATTKVQLFWEDASMSGVFKFDSLGVARWSGSAWENANCYGSCPPDWISSTAQRTYTGSATGTGIGTVQSNTVSAFGPFTLSSIGIFALNPLPVNLVNFGYDCDNSSINLNWTTASEINNDFFTIEKSRNGREFQELTKVKGAGNSTNYLKYGYSDQNPEKGLSYYRLSQTDFDGQSAQLNTISVRCSDIENTVITAYNNNEGNIVILSDLDSQDDLKASLYDALGKQIRSGNYVSHKGVSTHLLDITGLNSGIYLLNIRGNLKTVTKKIVIR